MNMTKGTRIILLSIAALLIAGALLLNASITEKHPYSGAAKTLREYGYTLDDDDFYNAGSFPDSTIQDILAGQDLSEAVAASIEGGFPSDINARGDIMLLLLTLENKDVVTVFTRDGKAELCFTDEDGRETRETIMDFGGSGIIQGIHNTDKSILSFAHSCFRRALDMKQDLWFSAKDTISKTYDHRFKDIFAEVYEADYKRAFEEAGITYFYTLIDDAVARVIRSEGGFIWALKNYDGDVMSDMLATAFGSLAMMTSVLVAPTGQYEYEAAHGTVTRHYYRYLKGEDTSTNPVATIFAWTGALRKRGELDGTPDLCAFADRLDKATLDTIAGGQMTGDLARLYEGEAQTLTSAQFMDAIAARM